MWLAVLLAALPATSDTDTPTVRRAFLFKNGLAYVHRAATLPAGASELVLVDLPPPVHGTVSVHGPIDAEPLASLVARATEVRERSPAGTLPELLRANVGHALRLHLEDGTTLDGTLTRVTEPELPPLEALRTTRRGAYGPYGYGQPGTPAPPLLALADGTRETLLSVADVKRVSAVEGVLAHEFEHRRAAAALTLRAERPSGQDVPLELRYLVRGLSWAPSTVLDLSEPGHARLTTRAVVVNESEDLSGTTLELVTGYPNLTFGHVIDPLALRGDLAAFFRALRGEPEELARVMGQYSPGGNAIETGSFPALPSVPSDGAHEDLYCDTIADVHLARGETGLFHLFSATVPVRHVHRWTIPETPFAPPPAGKELPRDEVWHALRVQNDTGRPWTTAPVVIEEEGRVLGQVTLPYTPAGVSALVPITRAFGLVPEIEEVETDRTPERLPWIGNVERITLSTRLAVANRTSEAVSLEIEKVLRGRVTENPGGAEVTTPAADRRFPPQQRLRWTLALAAGERTEVRYTSEILVRR